MTTSKSSFVKIMDFFFQIFRIIVNSNLETKRLFYSNYSITLEMEVITKQKYSPNIVAKPSHWMLSKIG